MLQFTEASPSGSYHPLSTLGKEKSSLPPSSTEPWSHSSSDMTSLPLVPAKSFHHQALHVAVATLPKLREEIALPASTQLPLNPRIQDTRAVVLFQPAL